MKTAVFSARRYDQTLLTAANTGKRHALSFLQDRLTLETVALAKGCAAVCVFVNDTVDAAVLAALAAQGTKLVATRSTGFNHIDAVAADKLGIAVVRVTDYSPYSVAEFAVGLLLAVNRKIARASTRTRDGNFELDGLMGFDLHGKTVGVVGTGKVEKVDAVVKSDAEWKKARLPTQEEWFAALNREVKTPAAIPPGPWAPVTSQATDRTPAGLLGMAGSVCEWTSKPAPNPTNPLGEKLWVIIGGSYQKPGSNALTREWTADRTLRRPDLGFRVVFDAQ